MAVCAVCGAIVAQTRSDGCEHCTPNWLCRILRARAAAKGVTLATPPDSQREIDIRTGKPVWPEPVDD